MINRIRFFRLAVKGNSNVIEIPMKQRLIGTRSLPINYRQRTMRKIGVSICLSIICMLPVLSYASPSGDESKPIQIEADHATLDQKRMVTVFSGRVVITKGTLVVHASEGTATQDNAGDRTLLLTGSPVTFVQKADDGGLIEGQGNKFDYNTKTSLAILTGRARVKKGKNLIVGDMLTYNTKTKVYSAAAIPANGIQPMKTNGRITVILDEQDGAVKK